MRTAFMGSDDIALPMLDFLHRERPAGFELAAVYTQPDRPSGRGMRLRMNPVKEWACAQGIPVHQPAKCSMEDAEQMVRDGIELIVVMAYGQLLPKVILEVPPLGILNLHASLLPRLRGPSPIHTAVATGSGRTGVCLMKIVPKMDAGPVALKEPVPIAPGDTTADVHAKLAQACVPLMRKSLPMLESGKLVFEAQNEEEVTYCRIITKEDAHLDFREPAFVLANRIRAFQPWPGNHFPYEGTEIRILAAEVDATVPHVPGTLMREGNDGLRIACGEGSLRVLRLQRPGGRPLETGAFLRGFPLADGSVLENRPMRMLEDNKPFRRAAKAKSGQEGNLGR